MKELAQIQFPSSSFHLDRTFLFLLFHYYVLGRFASLKKIRWRMIICFRFWVQFLCKFACYFKQRHVCQCIHYSADICWLINFMLVVVKLSLLFCTPVSNMHAHMYEYMLNLTGYNLHPDISLRLACLATFIVLV